jgi:hypothetical protein
VARTGAIVVVAAAVLFGMSTQPSPDVVPQVVVINEGVYPLNVSVGRPADAGRLSLGAVQPESNRQFLDVLDQGGTWVVTLRSGTVALGDFEVPASELADGWPVPDSVNERLDALGLRPVLSVEELARAQGTAG